VLREAITAAGTQVVTVGLRRTLAAAGDNGVVQGIVDSGVHLLPNTAGCRTAREAIALAHMARELYGTRWLKLEVVGDEHTLQRPGHSGRGAQLIRRLRRVPLLHRRSRDLPAPARRGLRGADALGRADRFGPGPDQPVCAAHPARAPAGVVLIVDAGMEPSHAAGAGMGIDAVLLNSAVSQAADPVRMAGAFRQAIEAGRAARLAGVMARQDFAVATTPVTGQPFLIGNAP
jgi:thiazole synthase